VETYLSLRFPGADLSGSFARALHQQTEGHPLFLVTLADLSGSFAAGLA
jgi:hypothetical protein